MTVIALGRCQVTGKMVCMMETCPMMDKFYAQYPPRDLLKRNRHDTCEPDICSFYEFEKPDSREEIDV